MKSEPTNDNVLKAVAGIAAKVDAQAKQTDERFNDVLEAVNTLSTHVDGEFRRVNEQFRELKGDVTQLKGDVTQLKGDVTQLKGDVTQMKATMVTKDYLDDKLADLRGDLVVLMRKEDRKVTTLVEVLQARKVISDEDAKRVLAMEPFPQSAK